MFSVTSKIGSDCLPRFCMLSYIRDELGHANISTTSLYLNTDAKQRQKVVSEAFTGV
ncbi:MAG: hypothetical protein WC856_28695 [Methylococcaceae bacterium]